VLQEAEVQEQKIRFCRSGRGANSLGESGLRMRGAADSSAPAYGAAISPVGELALTSEVEEKLESISRATVQRLLARFQQDAPKLPRRKPQPPNRLLREVPMERLGGTSLCPGASRQTWCITVDQSQQGIISIRCS